MYPKYVFHPICKTHRPIYVYVFQYVRNESTAAFLKKMMIMAPLLP